MGFNEEQIERYSRNIILAEVGPEGQERICQAKVLIIGAGGLGSPAALYLAAAGIGTLGIADGDLVEISNLQRQIIHFTADVGKPKVVSAKEKIGQLNSYVKVITYQQRFHAHNIADIVKEYDFIIDGTDNFAAKFLINDACVFLKKPFSHGGILGFEGQAMTYIPGATCYRCIFRSSPPANAVPSCSQAGVLGAVAGLLGTVQAAEAFKYILGRGQLLANKLLIFNALHMDFRTVAFRKNPRCPICGEQPTITTLTDEKQPLCELRRKKD